MKTKIEYLTYYSTFIGTLLIMIPLSNYVALQEPNDVIFFTALVSMTAIASTLHLTSYKYLIKKSQNNEFQQHNILFVGTIIFLELHDIEYKISKTETNTSFAFNVNWRLSDPETEQLRSIFCSMCIHNFKGITPTQTTKREIQSDWEQYLQHQLNNKEKEKLWKDQTQKLQSKFKNNKKLLQATHQLVQINTTSEEILQFIKSNIQQPKKAH